MDFKGAIEQLVSIEQSFDVNSVLFRGVHVWPLIRLGLWGALVHKKTHLVEGQSGCIQYPRVKPDMDLHAVLPDAGKYTDILFFNLSKEYHEVRSGKYYNRFADPFIEFFGDRYSIQKMEFTDAISHTTQPRWHPSLYCDPQKETLQARPGKTYRLSHFDELARAVFQRTGFGLDETLFLSQICTVLQYENYFRYLLKAIQPKAVFLVCYYHPVGMALAKACKGRGIPCVDYQHGKQGKYQGLYTHWISVPPGGYDLLPDVFWSWGKESVENISRWIPSDAKRHKAEVGGNLWLTKWLRGDAWDAGEQGADWLNGVKDRFSILLSLQPIHDPLPQFVMDAMAGGDDSWIWIIRTHPLFKNMIEDIERKLEVNNITNYEIRISSNLPLYYVLREVDHHVTAFSSVCYEALYFNVKTTLFHETGFNLYSDYINKDIFNYASNSQDILHSVMSSTKEEIVKESSEYIVTDIQYADKCIQDIISNNIV